jgi:putative ABC transport system permease protein
MIRDIGVIIGLSTRDFVHELSLSTCAILGIAAILAPLLVLFGLKFGIVSSMTARLAADPRARALQPIGQGRFDAAWFATLEALPQTGFVMPTTRFLAATVILRNPKLADVQSLTTELWPTGRGDPLREADEKPAPSIDRVAPLTYTVALSASTAKALRAAVGDRLEGRIGRSYNGNREALSLCFTVAQILNAGLIDREVALVPLTVLTAVEDYREGIATPEFPSADASPMESRSSYASFRLYARSIDEVEPLQGWLALHGVEAVTRLHDIQALQRLSRDLTSLFVLISTLAGIGTLVWIAISSLSTVARKQRELSLLRLVGFSTGSVAAFPIVQAVLTAVMGVVLASLAVLATAPVIDQMFAGQLPPGAHVFRLHGSHFLVAVLITASSAAAAASLAGIRAARITPSEGLRDE